MRAERVADGKVLRRGLSCNYLRRLSTVSLPGKVTSDASSKYLQPNLSSLGCVLFVSLVIWLFLSAGSFAHPLRQVLLLNSYSYDQKWTRNITEAVSNDFAGDADIELVIEFMDTKRHHSQEHYANLLQLLKNKYRNAQFDVIITSDDNATNFALEHRGELFPGVPIVFCGVNNLALPQRSDFINITGSLEVPGIDETLRVVAHLHPDLETLYVVNEPFTITSRQDRDFIESALAGYADTFRSVWLEDLSDEDMAETLGQLGADSAVLLLSFFPHKEKKTFVTEHGARFVSSASTRPVYSMWEYFLGEGIVGGKLTSGTYQGHAAAQIARDVLAGKDPASIPVVSKTANQFMFDFKQLKRFDINIHELPPGSIVINDPVDGIGKYRNELLAAVIAIAVLSCICGFLFLAVRARRSAEKRLGSVNLELQKMLDTRGAELEQIKRTEQALKESQKATEDANLALQVYVSRLRVLMESIPDLVWLKDMNGFFLFCNERFEKLYGASESEIVGKTDYDFIDNKLADFFRERDKLAMSEGKPVINEETLIFRSDGHMEVVETIKTPMYDHEDKLIGVLGIARDITARKRIAEELKESELRFKALHNASFGGIIIHDRGKILDCNQGLTDITGFTQNEILGIRADLLVAEPFRPTVINHTRAGYDKPYEVVGLRKNGDKYPLQIAGKNIPYKGKSVRVAEFRDISERKKAEADLKESELRHRIIFENSPVSIFRISEEGKILNCNDKFLELLGSSREEILGFDALHHGKSEKFRDAVRKALSGEPASCEEYCTSLTGDKTAYVHMQLNPVNPGQSPTAVIGTIEDLTARKEVEDRLRIAKEEAESANCIKSQFLANMSHEIRTPLNGVVGMLQLLQDSEIDDTQREYLEMAVKSAKRLTQLLSDILDISRVEADKLPITEGRFSIAEQRDAVLEMFSASAAEKGLVMEFAIDKTMPAELVGDEVRLGQILFNLVGNALKFTDSGGVYIDVVPLRTFPDNTIRVLFTITDTGIGFDDNEVNKIFEPFYQVDGQYTRRFQGAGLGLPIVKKLVALMRGSLAIDYEEGSGTCFYISLPFRLLKRKEEEVADLSNLQLNKAERAATILVAEDDELSSLIVKKLLEKVGYHILVAGNGAQALKIFRENPIDLVVMDIQMPIMDGISATEAIRSGDPGENHGDIPIIALTGYAMSGDKEKFMEVGIDGYLEKPIDGRQLCSMVKDLLETAHADG